MTANSDFIQGYLADPAQAVSEALVRANQRFLSDDFDEEIIYRELATPEFRLYEEIVLAEETEIFSRAGSLVSVA